MATDEEKITLLRERFDLDEDSARAVVEFITAELTEYKHTGNRSAAKLAAWSAAEQC